MKLPRKVLQTLRAPLRNTFIAWILEDDRAMLDPEIRQTIAGCYERCSAECEIIRRANCQMLMDALRVIERGHYNDAIRDMLAKILDTEGLKEAAANVRQWPDRTFSGVEEGWVYSCLTAFCSAEAMRLWQLEKFLRQKERSSTQLTKEGSCEPGLPSPTALLPARP